MWLVWRTDSGTKPSRLLGFLPSLTWCQSWANGGLQRRQEVVPLWSSLCCTDPRPSRTVQHEGVTHICREKQNLQRGLVFVDEPCDQRSNSQRECVISRTARLLTGTESRKVCVLWWASMKGLWRIVRRVSTRMSLNRNRPTLQTSS